MEIAVAMETAIHDASELQSELNPVPHVDKLTERSKTTPAKPVTTPYCYRCGGNTHMTHKIVFTRSRFPTIVEKRATSSEFVVPKVHAVEVDVDTYEDNSATFEVHNVRKQSNDITWVDLDIDGKPLKMELDTGSAVSIISFDLY